jgi:tetratricopeptide (TPR) repeat protein
LNPSYALAHHYYSMLLSMEGRIDEASSESDHAVLLDPLAPNVNVQRGVLFLSRGDSAAARIATYRALGLNPKFIVGLGALGVLEATDGHFAEAQAALERAFAVSPHFPGVRSTLVYVYGRLGQKAKADSMLASLRTGKDDPSRIETGFAEAMVGDVDRAFATFAHAHWDMASTINLRTGPLLAPLRKAPQYGKLLKEMGLKP